MAPEFQIVNESSNCGYLNFMQVAVRYGIYVNAPDLAQAASSGANGFDLVAAYQTEMAIAADAAALVERLNLLMTANQLSATTVATMVNALNATPLTAASPITARQDRVGAAVLMVLASREYLIQK